MLVLQRDGINPVPCIRSDIGAGDEDVPARRRIAAKGLLERLREDGETLREGAARDCHLLAADEVESVSMDLLRLGERFGAHGREGVARLHQGPAMDGGIVETVAADFPSGEFDVGAAEARIVVVGPDARPVELVHFSRKQEVVLPGNAAVEAIHETCVGGGVEPRRGADTREIVDHQDLFRIACRDAGGEDFRGETLAALVPGDDPPAVQVAPLEGDRRRGAVDPDAFVEAAVIHPCLEEVAFRDGRRFERVRRRGPVQEDLVAA